MQGLLISKKPGTQFLLLISICLASFFIVGLLGTVVLSKITGMSLEEMSDSSKWDYNSQTLVTVIRGMQLIQFISLFIIPTFLCAWLFGTHTRTYLGLHAPWGNQYYLAGIALLLLALPLVNLLGEWNRDIRFPAGLAQWMKEQEDEAAKSVQALLSRHSVNDLVWNILSIAGLAAVGEELLFRGMAQRLLIKLFRNPWAGIAVTAFIFAAMHVQFYGFLPRFVLGILLGAIYWFSGSLFAAILAHFVYDAFLIVVVYFNPATLQDENSLQASNSYVGGILSAAAVAAIVIWMKRRSATRFEEVYAPDAVPPKDHPF